MSSSPERSRTCLAAESMVTIGLTAEQQAAVAQNGDGSGRETEVQSVASVTEALQHPVAPGDEILMVAGLDPQDRERALAAVDPDGLPRWIVVDYQSGGWRERLVEARTLHNLRREVAQSRGDLLTIARRVNHELRSPLGSILTSADVIKEEMGDGSPAAQALTGPIIDSAQEVLTLFDRVALVARASAAPPALEEVDVGTAVWTAREHLLAKSNAAEAEISEPDDWPNIRGVRTWVERMWLELLDNALRYAGPRPRIELGWEPTEHATRFFVRDHGHGPAPEIRGTLFRPFHRLYERDSGRGMGLAIVRRLAELHGGTCGVESPATGDGAQFYFVLPNDGDGAR